MTALRLIRDSGYGARGNVALTAAMAELHAAGKIPDTLRIYRYPESVLLGRNQSPQDSADLALCNARNIEIARRVTGGGAIYMDRGVVTFDLVISGRAAGADARNLSAAVCSAIANGLRAFGADARFRPENDIVARGKKIAGASGYADGSTFVYQGSLMLSPDLDVMAAVLRILSLRDHVTTLSALCELEVNGEEVSGILSQSIAGALGRPLVSGELSEEEKTLQHRLFADEFGQDGFVFSGGVAQAVKTSRAAA